VKGTDLNIRTQTSGYLHYQVKRVGLPDTGTFTVTVQPLDAFMTVSPTPKVYTNPAMLQVLQDSISYTLSAGITNGQQVSYALKIYNGYYYLTDTVRFIYGQYSNTIIPTTSALTGWTNNGWGVSSTVFYSPSASITDSPFGNYADNSDTYITLTSPVDLTNATHAYMQFFARWYIEPLYDYVAVKASIVGSGTWQPLCGKYTRPGTTYQLSGLPIYDGQRLYWLPEQIDLGDYLGKKINIRFELVADPGVNYDGFYFDDLKIISSHDSVTSANTPMSDGFTWAAYPNPASDKLTIAVNSNVLTQPLQISIYDCIGRVVRHLTIDKPFTTIDVKDLPANVYYLKVEDKQQVFPVQKVVVVK
jgi:hypothetical protein